MQNPSLTTKAKKASHLENLVLHWAKALKG